MEENYKPLLDKLDSIIDVSIVEGSYPIGEEFIEIVENTAIAFANWYSDRYGPDEKDFNKFLKQYKF